MQGNNLGSIYPKPSFEQVPYTIRVGIRQGDIDKLIEYTNIDPFFKNNTSDLVTIFDLAGRFANIAEYDKWYAKGKYIYTLIDPEDKLVGIVWFSKELRTLNSIEYGFTFGMRLYGQARGIGLAKNFARIASEHFFQTDIYQNEPKKGIWLETGEDNLPAINTYKKLGYKIVKPKESTKTTLMALEK